MPLTIIKGPPNSGRTEEVRRRYMDLLPRRPVLVVPSVDDIFGWERRLARGRDALVGGRIVHFKDLVTEILGTQEKPPPQASAIRRESMVRDAFDAEWPALSARIRRQPGLIQAMLQLIDDLRNGLVDPESFESHVAGIGSSFLENTASVYRAYLERLAESGLSDSPSTGLAALKTALDGWSGRPVFVVGFDDLTGIQHELLNRLGSVTDVTIAITHEDANPSMAVTDRLLARLVADGGVVDPEASWKAKDEEVVHDQLLLDIEKNFMRLPEGEVLQPGRALTFLNSSGNRGEAEAVAAEIATLVDSGINPGQIAIGVSQPAVNGGRFRDLLAAYDVPVTLESETAARSTATGRAVLELIGAAVPGAGSADLISCMRATPGLDQSDVDVHERRASRSGAETATEVAKLVLEEGGTLPPGWIELTAPAGESIDRTELIAKVAAETAETILASDPSPTPDVSTAIEMQIAVAIGQACADLKDVEGERVDLRTMATALSSDSVKTWSVPALNTVRIASPYSLRSKRFEHLFLTSLQERGLSSSGMSSPFIDDDLRGKVGLPEYMDPDLQDRYLFYSCLSVPTKGLWLSCRTADESGKAEFPSPLIEEVKAMFGDRAEEIRHTGRTGADSVFPIESAPSDIELTRSITALTSQSDGVDLTGLEVEAGALVRAEVEIGLAESVESSTRTLPSLTQEAAIAILANRDTFSATQLEAFTRCPYCWFIERALAPRPFEPDPDHMAKGTLVHAVLKDLYDERPGRIPRQSDLAEWKVAIEPLLERKAASREIALGSDSPSHRIIRRQAVAAISAFLTFEAGRDEPDYLPSETEASFGLDDDGKGPLEIDDWKLRGSIDRIDRSRHSAGPTGGTGVVIDYKTGKAFTKAEITKQKKLQLQLYMAAMELLWETKPVGGFYAPVGVRGKEPRGILDKAFKDNLVDLDRQARDRTDEFREEIDAAIDLATEVVGKIMSGEIEHDPTRCVEHYPHAAVPGWSPDDPDEPGGD